MQWPFARFTAALLGVALVVLSIWSIRYLTRYQPLAALMAGPGGLGQIGLKVDNAKVTGRVDGIRRWQVSATEITLSRDLRQATVDGLHQGLLYDASQRPLASLQAGAAVYRSAMPIFGTTPQGFLQIQSGIQAHLLRPYGPTVDSVGLTWNPVTNMIQSAGKVSARFPAHAGAIIGGARLAANGVQWNALSDLLQSQGSVKVVFAQGVGGASGTGVSVNLHTGDFTLKSLTGTFTPHGEVKQKMAQKKSRSLLVLAALALPTVSPAAASAPPQPVTYSAGASLWLNTQHQLQMSQGVTIRQGDTTLQTQSAVINLNDKQQPLNAVSHAPVHLWNTQSDLTGQQGTIDFTTHVATVTGNVVLVVKPGPANADAPKSSLQSRFKSPATLTCDLMTYNYQTKQGVVPGPLTIHQKDRVLTADSGTYDGRTQIITLIGDVHGHDASNDIHATQALVGVRQGEEFIRVNQPLHGVFNMTGDKSSDSDDSSSSEPVDDPAGYQAIMNGNAAPAASSAAPPADSSPADSSLAPMPVTVGPNLPTPPSPKPSPSSAAPATSP